MITERHPWIRWVLIGGGIFAVLYSLFVLRKEDRRLRDAPCEEQCSGPVSDLPARCLGVCAIEPALAQPVRCVVVQADAGP